MPYLFTAYPGQASVGMPKIADFLTRKTCQPDQLEKILLTIQLSKTEDAFWVLKAATMASIALEGRVTCKIIIVTYGI